MEAMKIRNLYNLEETIAAPLLEQYEYCLLYTSDAADE